MLAPGRACRMPSLGYGLSQPGCTSPNLVSAHQRGLLLWFHASFLRCAVVQQHMERCRQSKNRVQKQAEFTYEHCRPVACIVKFFFVALDTAVPDGLVFQRV